MKDNVLTQWFPGRQHRHLIRPPPDPRRSLIFIQPQIPAGVFLERNLIKWEGGQGSSKLKEASSHLLSVPWRRRGERRGERSGRARVVDRKVEMLNN